MLSTLTNTQKGIVGGESITTAAIANERMADII